LSKQTQRKAGGIMPQKKVKKAIKSKIKAIKRRLDTTDEALAYERGLVHKANNPKLAKKYIKTHTLIEAGLGAIGGGSGGLRSSAKKRGKLALGGALVGGISGYLSAKKAMKKRKKKKKE
jgi:hypothetical protein